MMWVVSHFASEMRCFYFMACTTGIVDCVSQRVGSVFGSKISLSSPSAAQLCPYIPTRWWKFSSDGPATAEGFVFVIVESGTSMSSQCVRMCSKFSRTILFAKISKMRGDRRSINHSPREEHRAICQWSRLLTELSRGKSQPSARSNAIVFAAKLRSLKPSRHESSPQETLHRRWTGVFNLLCPPRERSFCVIETTLGPSQYLP